MDIILSFNSGAEVLKLPVLPEQLEVVTGLSNNTYEVISLGEIGIIGNRKLNAVTISAFFPRHYASYCQYRGIPDPQAAVGQIERWRDSRRPIRLTITGSPLSVSMPCMIEEFSYREKGGQPGDIYYDLSLKEYRFIKPRVIRESDAETGQNHLSVSSERPDERQRSGTYVVMKGDCLYIIAKKVYKDGSRWKELYEKNRDKIGDDPDLIQPGWELSI